MEGSENIMFEVKEVDISEIQGYDRNAKIHTDEQVRNIAESIKKFGWQQPVVLDSNNVIVVGHGRVEAARLLGLEAVPVKYADNLTEDEIKAYRLLDNRISVGEIDVSLETLELGEIDIDLSNFSLDLPETFSVDDIGEVEGYNAKNDNREYFEKTFTFPISKKKQIISYLKKHQNEIIQQILKECETDVG